MKVSKLLNKQCFRCKFRIGSAEKARSVIVGGIAVVMHEQCALAWEREDEAAEPSEERRAA